MPFLPFSPFSFLFCSIILLGFEARQLCPKLHGMSPSQTCPRQSLPAGETAGANGTTQVMGTEANACIFQTPNEHDCGGSWTKRPRSALTAALPSESASQSRGSAGWVSALRPQHLQAPPCRQTGVKGDASVAGGLGLHGFQASRRTFHQHWEGFLRNCQEPCLPGWGIRWDKDCMGAFEPYECHAIENIFKK